MNECAETDGPVSSAFLSAERLEQLLDRFPVKNDELPVLLRYHDAFYQSPDATVFWSTETPFARIVQDVVPDLYSVFTYACENAFVLGSGFVEEDESVRLFGQSLERFLEACTSLLGRRGERYLWDILFDYVQSVEQHQTDGSLQKTSSGSNKERILSFIYRLALVCYLWEEENSVAINNSTDDVRHSNTTLREPDLGAKRDDDGLLLAPRGWMSGIASSSTPDCPTVSRVEWRDWAQTKGHGLHTAVSTVFDRLLFGSLTDRQSVASFHLPMLDSRSLVFSRPEPSIALTAMGLGGTWHSIYDSDHHGLSFRVFQEALLRYDGPTVILIHTTTPGQVIGYFSQVSWKVSHKWYTGEGESFLFSLMPAWGMFPFAPSSPNTGSTCLHQFLYIPVSDALQQAQHPPLRGLAVGGVAKDAPRLYIPESLEQCRACVHDLTFAQGSLLSEDNAESSSYFFDVDRIQTFAVGSSDESFHDHQRSGALTTALRETTRQRLAQVDRKQFVQDFANGTTILNNLFDHREQARGRASFVAHDDEGKGCVHSLLSSLTRRSRRLSLSNMSNVFFFTYSATTSKEKGQASDKSYFSPYVFRSCYTFT